MILCGILCVILFAGMILLRRQVFWERVRSPCYIFWAFSFMGFLAAASGNGEADAIASGQVARNDPGDGMLETEAYVYLHEEETEYPVTIAIPERKFQKEEEQKLLAEAEEEMKASFCGENPSLDRISSNPRVLESYRDGKVSAEWMFSETDMISMEGEIFWEEMTKERQKVKAFVEFKCGGSEAFHEFSFWIVSKEKSKREKTVSKIKEQIAMQDETEKVVRLPDSVAGQKITWRGAEATQELEILGLGAIASFAAFYTAKEQKEKQKQKRKRNLLLSYPEFVSKLSLLLGAGMTISGALKKMNQMYQIKQETGGRKEEVYEELHRMVCEMDNGMGEFRAYQDFSERCDLQPYRKLVSLLTAGQKAGSRKLMEKLNEEADRVFLERKNAARRLGEEAGTKMLFPMMLLLVIVMAIVIVPAFLSIYGT